MFRKDVYKNPLEYKVNNVLKKTENKKFDSIFFATSVTYGTTRQFKLREDLLDLGTTAGVGFVGQYYMLNRFLKNDNKVKNVYFFVLPESFNPLNYSPFVFDNKEELNFSLEHGMEEKQLDQSYFYSRLSYLKFWNSTHRVLKKSMVLKETHYKLQPFSNYAIINENNPYIINNTVELYFKSILKICEQNSISVTFVIEPMSANNYIEYLNSGLDKYLTRNENINVLDINKIHLFNDKDFFDGRHLNENSKKVYLSIIDKHVKKLGAEF